MAAARLTLCRYVQRERMLYVRFADAAKDYRLPAEYLRAFSPAARAAGPDGRPAIVSRRKFVGIMHIDPVGRYGLRLAFDDMHAEGIFSFDLLRELAQHKLSNLRMYIRELRERGLSRDPRVRPAPLRVAPDRVVPGHQ